MHGHLSELLIKPCAASELTYFDLWFTAVIMFDTLQELSMKAELHFEVSLQESFPRVNTISCSKVHIVLNVIMKHGNIKKNL